MLVLDPVVVAIQRLPPWALALGGVVVAAAAVLAARTKPRIKSRKIHTLGTKIPIIGDLLESAKNDLRRHDWFSDVSLRFGNEPWQMKIPGNPTTIVISDPAVYEAVFVKHTDVFIKTEVQRELVHDVFGDGILNTEGEPWFHQRKTASKFFTARTLRQCMMQTMHRNIKLINDELDAVSGTGRYAKLGNLVQQFALQTFLEVGVGIDAPIIGNSESHPMDAVDEAAMIASRRRMLPKFLWKLKRLLNVGTERNLEEKMERVNTYIKQLIDQVLSKQQKDAASGANQDEKIRTAVELFLQHSADDKAGLRPRDIVDFVLNFVFASRDTSSVATSWLLYEVSKHPEVEAKIREEFATKLTSLGVGRDGYITADQVKQFVYLEAVIKETLRLHTPAPMTSRTADEDIVIDGDLFIRKGQSVIMSAYSMSRNPRVWGPDAAEFKPERWIDTTTGELISAPPTKFASFGAGPHQCVGMKLAMLNLRVLTANLLHRYRFTADPTNDGTYITTMVLSMKHPLLAKVERV